MKKHALLALMTAILMGITSVVPAMAVTANEGVIGGTTTFDKYLVMDEGAHVPAAKFTFTAAPGTAKTYDVDGKKIEILTTVATPGNMTAEFADSDETYPGPEAQEGDQVKDLADGQKYVKKTLTVDFSGITFPEPGVYRYVITEEGEYQGVTNDENAARVLDVYVVNGAATAGDYSDKDLKIAGYILHSTEDDITMSEDYGSDGSDPEGKSQGFTNVYHTEDLLISKTVKGNQGSADKYFKIHVDISDAAAGTIYDVDLTDADINVASNNATKEEYAGMTNPAQLTAGEDGTVSADFYLQGGQSVKIIGLAEGTKAVVTETEEDYKPSVAVAGDAAANEKGNGADVLIDAETADENSIALTNTRQGVIPTGVIMSFLPYLLLAVLGLAGILFTRKRKK